MNSELIGQVVLTPAEGDDVILDASSFTLEEEGRRNLGDGDFQDERLYVLDAGDAVDTKLPCQKVLIQVTRMNNGKPVIHTPQLFQAAAGVTCDDSDLSIAEMEDAES